MINWIKIQSFGRIHQAELRKDILEQNNINCVIINEKDSLFLLGDIALYVEEKNENKAKALIDEFSGLTKINSFIDMKPVLLFQKVLLDGGIKTSIKRRDSRKYLLGNYELYIENENLDKVIPYLTGEKLKGWKKIMSCTKIRQTKFYIDLLSENLINSIIIKKKDTDYHLELINIYIKEDDFEKAEKVIRELKGFKLIKESGNLSVIEKIEETLTTKEIKALLKKEKNSFKLFVENKNFDDAKELIANDFEWIVVQRFSNIANAMYYKSILDTAGIPSVILNEQDSSFLLGDIDLFVEKEYINKAKELIENL